MTNVPSWWRKPRQVAVVVDNESWVLPFARNFVVLANAKGDNARLIREYKDVSDGAVAFYLGCLKICPPALLARNQRNLVVHASDLPKGRGLSPLSWLILSGENRIPVCLLEAIEAVDAGPIIYKEWLAFEGHELNDEIRDVLGETQVRLCQRFLDELNPPIGISQKGEVTTFERRRPEDSRLDPHKTIVEQFNLLRIVDNQRYPAFFDLRGHEYELRIEKRKRKKKE
jgi:methionyl-tRNA formyltransferase